MTSLVPLIPWVMLAVPLASLPKWYGLRDRRRQDYAHYIEWKEFSIRKIALGKLAFFLLIGLASLAYSISFDKTVVALAALGICGYMIEASIAYGRPMPTPGYRITGKVCQKCGVSDHEHCTNLRMLDGFEKKFTTEDGHRRPVCCCGFRLSKWEEALA
jgi:hypothetical protein